MHFFTQQSRMPLRIFSGIFVTFEKVLLAAALALVIVPVAVMLISSFAGNGGLSVSSFLEFMTAPATVTVLRNTFIVVISSCLFALSVGAVFAWVNERTDASSGFMAEILPLVPLLIPQIAVVTGWVTLLSPQAGYLNALIKAILLWLGIELSSPPLNIFTYVGLIYVTTLYLIPYAYLIISSALQQLDPSLEEAGRVNGASPVRTLVRITLPAIAPALLNAGIIVFIFGISLFSVPIVIGTAAGIDVLAVRVYRLLYNYPPRMDQVLALSVLMMAFVQVAVAVQALVGRLGKFSVIGGKGQSLTRVELGFWRFPAKSLFILYILLTTVLPLAALVILSLQPFWSPRITLTTLSLQNFGYVLLENGISVRALWNSIVLGVVGATIGMLIAAILVTQARAASSWFQSAVEALTALPATIPQTVLGVAVLVTFSGGVFKLHGTLAILLLAYLLITLPQSMRSARVAVLQVGQDLVEAARIAKASPSKLFIRIMLPLMRPGLIAGWVILFISISGELTASALLSGTNNPVVGLVLLDLWENGSFPQLAAISVVMTILDVTVIVAVLHTFRLRTAIS
jgi:iron(III) transport system permease protein